MEEGDTLGGEVGESEGENDGCKELYTAALVGASVDQKVGPLDGAKLGTRVGPCDGSTDGAAVVGSVLGASEGDSLGSCDGDMLGCEDGACDGESDGCRELYAAALVGEIVG